MKKLFLPIISFGLLLGIGGGLYWQIRANRPGPDILLQPTIQPLPRPVSTTTGFPSPIPTPSSTPLPTSLVLDVPYTMQAPYNIWDYLHENACEEASLIMVVHFLQKTPLASQSQADNEIKALVAFETAHGYGPSITLAQLNQIAKDYYGIYNGEVIPISSTDQLEVELAAGHPLILGMAGKLLPNPYFSNGGPNYHMLVAKGYDATGIITNDPGTWHGDGFHYDFGAFYTAIHDWNPTNILNGEKAYLVFR